MNAYILFLGLVILSLPTLAAKECGRVIAVKGKVSWMKKGSGKWKKARLATKVCSGDEIKTEGKSRTKLRMFDKNTLSVGANSYLQIKKYPTKHEEKKVSLNLIYGSLRSQVFQKYTKKDSFFRVKTKAAVVGVRGTDFLTRMESGEKLEVVTFSGLVEVRPFEQGRMRRGILVRPGESLQFRKGGPREKMKPRKVSPERLQNLKRQSQIISRLKGVDLGAKSKKSNPPGDKRKQFETANKVGGRVVRERPSVKERRLLNPSELKEKKPPLPKKPVQVN